MSSRKNWQAWHNTSISRQLMCRPDSFPDQRTKIGLHSHSALHPLLEASHLKYRRSRWHKVPNFLETFERMGGTFLERSCAALYRRGSLRWDRCCHLHWVNNCAQERNSLAGWQYALGKIDSAYWPRQPKWLKRRVLYDCQNEPVVEVVEYADSHLSQRGESHIHALRKSAGSQGQPKR